MNPQRLLVQVIVGTLFFLVIAVIFEGDYSLETWLDKGKTALLFGLAYAIFLIVKERLRKKD